jgi:hypothetical protein
VEAAMLKSKTEVPPEWQVVFAVTGGSQAARRLGQDGA